MYKNFASEKVCVDFTHGTNVYDFLLMSLIVVVDEFGEGIPVASLISNKTDIGILTCFFQKVKERVGDIKTIHVR